MSTSLSISTSPVELNGNHVRFGERQLAPINTEQASLSNAGPRRHKPTSRQPYQRHDRRRDCFHILQTIVQEIEKREREDLEAAVRDIPEIALGRRTPAPVPGILINSRTQSTLHDSTICTPRSTSSSSSDDTASPTATIPAVRTVRFATEPPRVFRKGTWL